MGEASISAVSGAEQTQGLIRPSNAAHHSTGGQQCPSQVATEGHRDDDGTWL